MQYKSGKITLSHCLKQSRLHISRTASTGETWYMKKSMFSILALPIFLSVFAGFALALDAVDSFRCGSKLVMIGDTKIEVVSKCGEPAQRENVVRSTTLKKSSKKTAKRSGGQGTKVVERSRADEQWTYNFGARDFVYTLSFEGVELKSIGRGGRGTSP
jgi:hypothetical protein